MESDGFHSAEARHTPLCEAIGVGIDSEAQVRDFTQCHRDAIGLYRMEGHHGGETTNWLCEKCREQHEVIEQVRTVPREDTAE